MRLLLVLLGLMVAEAGAEPWCLVDKYDARYCTSEPLKIADCRKFTGDLVNAFGDSVGYLCAEAIAVDNVGYDYFLKYEAANKDLNYWYGRAKYYQKLATKYYRACGRKCWKMK